jgi:uncharacterized protein (TIGR02452 family)
LKFPHLHDTSPKLKNTCIPLYGALYHEKITAVKNDENYDLYDKPFEVNVISSAAFNRTYPVDPNIYEAGTRAKIEAQFRTAIIEAKGKGIHLILLPWGCGSFKNNPLDIAKQYLHLINEYRKYFKTITFVILPNDTENFKAFSDTLKPILSE